MSAQGGAPPLPVGRAPPAANFKHAAKVSSQPLAPLPPADESLTCRHLLHGEFGRRLCHILVLRCAKLSLATAKANMPVKSPATSLAGSIDSTFISEAVKNYTDLLFRKKVPRFEDLKNMKAPEGFVSSEPSHWYRPWVREVSKLTAAAPSEEENDPVIKMAGSTEPAIFTKEGKSPKESLLGYRWSPIFDTISTDKAEGLNLHPAKRGLRPTWACLRSPEDLLRLHAERPLRHRHALAAAHSTFDPLMACPWVAVLNKFCYRVLVLNTELKTSVKWKNNKEKYDDLLSTDYVKNHLYYMVDANLKNQVTFAQPRSAEIFAAEI